MASTDIASPPKLIEPGVHYFLKENLKQCKQTKYKYYNTIFNLSAFVGFFLILGMSLQYMYKGKLTEKQQEERKRKTEEFLLTKMRNVEIAKRIEQQDIITNLPVQIDEQYFFR